MVKKKRKVRQQSRPKGDRFTVHAGDWTIIPQPGTPPTKKPPKK